MAEHRDELRRQLMEAAHRTASPALRPAREARRRWLAPAARGLSVAASLVAIALLVVLVVDTRTVSADVFRVDKDGGQLVVKVVGEIDDPSAAREELRRLGLDVELVAQPAAPSLVGDVVSVSSDSPLPAVRGDGSRVRSFRVSAGSAARITIDYGRTAHGDERYQATESVPDCERLVGKTVTRDLAASLASDYGPEVEWREVGPSGVVTVASDDVADMAEVLDVVPVAPHTVMVVVTAGGPAAVPSPSGC